MNAALACETCAALNPLRDESNRGECRRRAPSLEGDALWPMVAGNEWCAHREQCTPALSSLTPISSRLRVREMSGLSAFRTGGNVHYALMSLY
jgi:hypothetical protein